MRVQDLLQLEADIEEWAATRSLCKSSKPDHALGASALASCKAQGYRARQTGKTQKVGKKRVKLGGKKLKSKDYGGPISPTATG